MKTVDLNGMRTCVSCLLAAAVMTMGFPATVQGGDAEAAGWELIFTDTFDREALGEHWEVLDGAWKIADGALVGSGTLVSARGFPGPDPHRTLPGTPPPGFIRLEYAVRTDVRPLILLPSAPVPKVSVSDLGAFIHAPPPDANTNPLQNGYFFQFGGFMNTRNMIRRAGNVLVEQQDPEIRIVQDKLHRIVVENDEGTLRFSVDGQTLFEHPEPVSIMGDGVDRVGFYFYTQARLEHVRVYVKRLDDGYF